MLRLCCALPEQGRMEELDRFAAALLSHGARCRMAGPAQLRGLCGRSARDGSQTRNNRLMCLFGGWHTDAR